MAGESHLLDELREQLEGLDDEALIALSSAGLLRRARKDLETLTARMTDGNDAIHVDIGAHQVRFDARGPGQARCTCPAKSVCQHVLSAWLFLRAESAQRAATSSGSRSSEPAPTKSAPALLAELLAVPLPALVKFAGLPAVREALRDAESSDPPAIEFTRPLKVGLLHPPVELRYAGGGLEAFVIDYRGKRREKLIVQAVLALQRANGTTHRLPEKKQAGRNQPAVAEPSAAIPKQLLTQVLDTLTECVVVGVVHLSANMEERLLSHAAAAEGAGLHRLSLALSRLANHIDLQLNLHASSSTVQLLDELALTYALASAISDARAPVPHLWGTARSEYEDIARLELVGVAAEPWSTPSGYTGLTLLLWSPAMKRWFSATESRPAGLADFDPVSRYRAQGPWSGCNSPSYACARQLTLTNARANRAGRLSLSGNTRAALSALPAWPEFIGHEYESWAALRTAVLTKMPGVGLQEQDPHATLVVLRPSHWREAVFDAAKQELCRTLVDAEGEELVLRVKYSTIAAHALERLENLRAASGSRLVGHLERGRSSISIRPIAVLRTGNDVSTDNLFFDSGERASLTDALTEKLRALLKAGGADDKTDLASVRVSATERRLVGMESELLRWAERGLSGHAGEKEFEHMERDLNACGLELLPASTIGAALPARVLRLKHCLMIVRDLQGAL